MRLLLMVATAAQGLALAVTVLLALRVVKVGRRIRFSPERFAKKYPVAKYPRYYCMQLDESLIPAALKTDQVKVPVQILRVSEVEVVSASVEIAQAAA